MKKLAIGLLICSLIAGIVFFDNIVRAEDKKPQVGYVDIHQVFINHPDKVTSENKLNEKAKELQAKLEEEAKNLSKEERQELLKKYEEELNNLEKELIRQVMASINEEIREVAKEKGISIVLDKQAIIYGGYDLTQDVLELIASKQNKEEDNQNQ